MPVISPAFSVKIKPDNQKEFWIKAVSNISVNLAADLPCDSAQVTVPTPREADLGKIKKGYEIEIALGFRDQKAELTTVFYGRVSSVSNSLPLVIEVEDMFSLARETDATGTYATDSAPKYYSEVAAEVLDKAGLGIFVPSDCDPGPDDPRTSFEYADKSVAQVMDQMAQETGWVYFLVPGTKEVYFGPPWPYHRGYLPKSGESKVLRFGVGNSKADPDESWGNIICAGNLQTLGLVNIARCNFVDATLQSLGVSGEYSLVEEGENEKLHSFNHPYDFPDGSETTRKNLEKVAVERAKEELFKLRAQKLAGSFITFGNPQLSHSHRIWLEWAGKVDQRELNDYYDAKRVNFTYSVTGGFRMQVEVQYPPGGEKKSED